MSRELLLMRHAKSDWSSGVSADFDRPLNKRGEQSAPKMGQWLAANQLHADHIVCSPAKRAKQTVQRVCPEINFDLQNIRWEQRVYEASLGDLLKVLAQCPPDAQRVLLIGHNPGLESLLLYLAGDAPLTGDGKRMTTASVARLRVTDTWAELQNGSARLLSLTRPRDLS